ncbi:hypothetical protein DFH09DRAFT_1358649 [Mycena vulgaris]|nr:hypothetical protein DFH09DRAFT_1358649 [Mycena vulgaris]
MSANENTAPPPLDLSKLHAPTTLDPARMLISPPPEEELQRTHTHVFGVPHNQVKRKRPGVGGTPSKVAAEPVETTPNPKPRKTHRRPSMHDPNDSPTRAVFTSARKSPHPRNPDADWVPAPRPREASARRSVTPYEPPPDVFVPPREVVLHTPQPRPKPKPRRQSQSVQPARTLTPLRVVVHSIKKELPPIDLARPMTPPSPTDDPLLLVASSSPIKRGRGVSDSPQYPEPSSDAAYAPFDWTAGLQEADDRTSDSMDLDPPASFDGPGPLDVSGGWDDSDDSDDDLPPSVPAITFPPSTSTSAAIPASTSTATTSTLLHNATTLPSTPTRASPRRPTPTHTHTHTRTATGPYTALVLPTKADPPTPRTRARADAWGVWGSPFPGAAVGEGSFRMDGRRRGVDSASGLFISSAAEGEDVGMGGEEEGEEEEEEEEMDEGVSVLRALREEDARSAEQEDQLHLQEEEQILQEDNEEEDQQQQDEEEEEEEEVRRMSVEPELELEPDARLLQTPGRAGGEQRRQMQTPPMRRAPVVPPRAERASMSVYAGEREDEQEEEDAGEEEDDEAEEQEEQEEEDNEEDGGAHVLTARGQGFGRMSLPASLRAADLGVGVSFPRSSMANPASSASTSFHPASALNAPAARNSFPRSAAAASTQVEVEAEAQVEAEGEAEVEAEADAAASPDDGDSSDTEGDALLGLVKITSADPRAAARAAAILKQHDYDCFTRLGKGARRRHSYGGVSKASASSASSPGRAKGMQDIVALRAQAQNEKNENEKNKKEQKKRRESAAARVVGERVYFPGSPGPVTTAQLLREAEAEVVGVSPRRDSVGSVSAAPRSATPAPAPHEENASAAWGKAEWKALDACFTDERIAVAARPKPARREEFSTPVRGAFSFKDNSGKDPNSVLLAPADAVDLVAVVARFERTYPQAGWDAEELMQRARALQGKQRAGHVAPPTPTAASHASPEDIFTSHGRRPSMEVPDFTPLGKRAMPPRRARLPEPVGRGAPFSGALPPTPEPARRRRVPGSLFAPRYSHLMEEAVSVGVGAPEARQEREEEREEEEESFVENEDEEEEEEEDAEMEPATPLREREARLGHPAPAPATIGKRVKGFLFSYLPTLAKNPPPAPRTGPSRPRLPLPPPALLAKAKERGPVATPVRPPLPKARAPKELVSLQPAPPPAPKTLIPRRAPRRLVELHHVSPPREADQGPRGARPRTSSGGSVKDLVKNFEALEDARARAPEVKRVRSVGDFGKTQRAAGAGAVRPMWRP